MWWAGAAAGASALGGLLGGDEESDAAEEAFDFMKKQGKKARAEMSKGFKHLNKAYNRQKGFAKPWMDAGLDALTQIQAGIARGDFDPGQFEFNFEDYKNSPGYAFQYDEMMKAADRGARAAGITGSGQQMKDLMGYAQGLAATEFDAAHGRAVTEHELERMRLGDKFNRLGGIVDTGANMTGNMMDAAGQHGRSMASLNQAMGQTYIGQAGQGMDAIMAGGTARANKWRNVTQSVNQGLANYGYYDMKKQYGTG